VFSNKLVSEKILFLKNNEVVSDFCVRNFPAAAVQVRVYGYGDTDVPGRQLPDTDVRKSLEMTGTAL
jgi:hypothetical protein